MAPIFAGEIGITPQIIDEERLVELRDSFAQLPLLVPLGQTYSSPDEVKEPLDIDKLIELIEPWQSWKFEEQVDLQEWVQPLNRIDACLSYYTQKYPYLLLIGPVQRTKSKGAVTSLVQPISNPASSLEEAMDMEQSILVLQRLQILLHFLAGLLMNSFNKAVFQSVDELVDLLAAADDGVATAALQALSALATPPALHKQQAPEQQHHATALHNSKSHSHNRIIALARGWGTRGLGLGLYTCATADDSEFGQGSLPKEAGELHFTYVRQQESSEEKKEPADDGATSDLDSMGQITLLREDIINDSVMHTEPIKSAEATDDDGPVGKQKRRRVAPILDEESIRSTPELFFRCLAQAGGLRHIPEDRLFSLLVEVRLARSFYCRTSRRAAIERRLRALIAVLHSNPSQEIVSGYFQAQPELCVELIDLLRPTVSSSSVSAASSRATVGSSILKQDAISALANAPTVPYDIRELALQALTALVARRDGSSGALTGVARHSNVLIELGVAKGQYLGLLPTLIRFSLASLGSLHGEDEARPKMEEEQPLNSEEALALDLGVTFIEAAMPPPLPRTLQLIRALEFVDSVLTLTSAVISTPSGTSALTEGGLVPALLTTVIVDHEEILNKAVTDASPEDLLRIKSLLRFVTAQAVQILEGAIVTHSNALTAFNNLQGVEILTKRLSKEILGSGYEPELKKEESAASDSSMDCDSGEQHSEIQEALPQTQLRCSQRVLLFSIVTCLSVVFHQESTSSSTTAPVGAAQLRTPTVTKAIITILDNADTYGGHLLSLVATLLSDIMNSEPLVTHHVHESGIAKAFLKFFPPGVDDEPVLHPIQELLMAVPNVLSALALTEAGSKTIQEANPFPALLKLFYHPKYAMPRSRCLLNEMTAIIGSALDEIMRNVSALKPLICTALVEAMQKVADMGKALILTEKGLSSTPVQDDMPASDLENSRSCLMQYVLNFGQVLEQILHVEDSCDKFVAAGGLDAILQLYPILIPTGHEFLAHISCLSCPSVSTLGHSTTEDSMTLAFKCVSLRASPFKVLQCLINAFKQHLDRLSELQVSLRTSLNSGSQGNGLDASFILEELPKQPIYELGDALSGFSQKDALSDYLRQVAVIQWLSGLLASTIKAACQSSFDTGSGWSPSEIEWKKELSSTEFEELLRRLSMFARTAIFEVCRIRTEVGFEESERQRQHGRKTNLRYRLRIVCPEGAVVRDGIEIDSCDSVGSMEMSEIVDAFDRCVNTSGVLRYRTNRGWVSEQTRGHGREPIAEVINVWVSQNETQPEQPSEGLKRRVENGVPDLRTSCANVLARVQANYVELLSGLSRLVFQSVRSVPVRTLSFDEGTIESHVSTVLSMLATEISTSLNHPLIHEVVEESRRISREGIAMYFGCLLSAVKQCLFDEKRDRRTVYVPLLIRLALAKELDATELEERRVFTIFDAIEYIHKQAVDDFENFYTNPPEVESKNPVGRRRLGRPTAASLPTALAILKRFISTSAITSSPASSVLSRVKLKDLSKLLGKGTDEQRLDEVFPNEESFSPEKFSRLLLCRVSESVKTLWSNPKLVFSPPHVLHPIVMLVGEVIVGLEEVAKKKPTVVSRRSRESSDLLNAFRGFVANRSSSNGRQAQEDFEPTEDAITRLMEMGFSRNHAWDALDSTRTNRIEVAMEYALTHPPPNSAEIERRRNSRAERRRQRESAPSENENNESGTNDNERINNESEEAESNEQQASNANETMDIDGDDDEDEDKKTENEEESILRAKSYVAEWKIQAVRGVCDILQGVGGSVDTGGDIEALTVVLSSFLMDLCQVYPGERDNIASQLFARLSSQIEVVSTGSETRTLVPSENELSFSVLCHATLLFTRALPRTRTLLLKEHLVHRLLGSIQSVLNAPLAPSPGKSPIWLASSLLLLDVMAQPLIAFSEDDEDSSTDNSSDTELAEVKADHKKQALELSEMARTLIDSDYGAKTGGKDTAKDSGHSKQKDPSSNVETEKESAEAGGRGGDGSLLFKDVKPFFPLIPLSLTTTCADACLQILDRNWHSPGVVQGVLLLLMRLLRSPSTSTHCMKAGLAEKVIGLPRESRFTGHSGLVTLVLRRLLEDEAVLQGSMEIELRGTIMKLHGKSKRSPSDAVASPSVSRKAFAQAIVPLLCREPISFLKALFVTVKFEVAGMKGRGEGRIGLLSSQERAKNAKLLSEVLRRTGKGSLSRQSQSRRSSVGKSRKSISTPRSKTPTRSNKRGLTPKRSKKDRDHKDRMDDELKNSNAGVVITLLIQKLAMASEPQTTTGLEEFDFGFESGMLWTTDVLDVLADLVLAIPACAATIHRFRPSKGKFPKNSTVLNPFHALEGGQTPPRSFVSYVLHHLLVQDRSEQGTRPGTHLADDEAKKQDSMFAKHASRKTRVSQSSARLIVALVARPGEGRKQVIGDLAFALSGGRLGLASSKLTTSKQAHQTKGSGLFALQTWAELCIGLAAPRSNGGNVDGNSSLSFDVIRIMLDLGMAHALLWAMQMVPLNHPRTTATVSALLAPFEVFSRPTVGDALKALEEKLSNPKDGKSSSKTARHTPKDAPRNRSDDTENRRDSFADDHMVEEAFAVDSSRSNNDGEGWGQIFREQANPADDEEGDYLVAENDPDMEEVMVNDDVGDDDDDMEIDEDVDDEEESDEMMSSSDESAVSSEDDGDEEDTASGREEDDDDDTSVAEDDDDTVDGYEESDVVDYEPVAVDEDHVFDDSQEGSGAEHGEQGIDDGWTRIESSGFGGTLLGARRSLGQQASGNVSVRTRGFIDAAEAMIGTLLRAGEIQNDALAELEGSLGIRIMHHGVRGTAVRGNRSETPGDSLFSSASRNSSSQERFGTLPQVHQRSQPDVGYSALGGGGRWSEINAMEYVFGGPSITAGNRNYDLIPRETDEDDLVAENSSADAPLFPGGPASGAHSRAQHSMHPLLCGIDLPPPNALVSDMLPHEVRATRRGQMVTRRPGDWTNGSLAGGGYLVSTSNGNIVRSTRGNNNASLGMAMQSRGVPGPIGWTDDGLPFDATVEEFSSAFEGALVSYMQTASEENARAAADLSNAVADEQGERASSEIDMEAERNNGEEEDSPMVESPRDDPVDGDGASNPEGNEGDVVASSLAHGLRLSPQDNEVTSNDRHEADGESAAQDNEDIANSAVDDNPETPENREHVEEEETANTAGNAAAAGEEANREVGESNATEQAANSQGLVCPPGMDPEVFNVLPPEMQQEVVDQARAASELASRLDAESTLDPEALAALPEDMRREVIEQEQRERRTQAQVPADPANAEEMDNASFVASLSPELREEILLTADDAFLQSLPANIIAEAQVLRERASAGRRAFAAPSSGNNENATRTARTEAPPNQGGDQNTNRENVGGSAANGRRKIQRAYGKIRVETDRDAVVHLSESGETILSPPVSAADFKVLLSFMYLLSPVCPSKVLQKVFQNVSSQSSLRMVVISAFLRLLHDDRAGALAAVGSIPQHYTGPNDWRYLADQVFEENLQGFPPAFLIGPAPEELKSEGPQSNITLIRKKQSADTVASMAANLPITARGSRNERYLPPVVATRIVDILQTITKNSPRFCIDILTSGVGLDKVAVDNGPTGFEKLLDLLQKPRYSKSSANLEQLLLLLESAVSPLSYLPKNGEEDAELSQKDLDAALQAGKEWVDVPRIVVCQQRLQLLCSILRMETCRDSSLTRVNTIARRLCRVDANRGYVLAELASVARALGVDAMRDLKSLAVRMSDAIVTKKHQNGSQNGTETEPSEIGSLVASRSTTSSVAVSSSTSELKLLRVLQTLQALCADLSEDTSSRKDGNVYVTEELVSLLQAMELDDLWAELTSCLKVVQVLEGVEIEEDENNTSDGAENEGDDENGENGKKLQNSVAGLLTRFLPSIEAFFVANASATRSAEKDTKSGETDQSKDDGGIDNMVGGKKLVAFVEANKVLLNALIRNNSGLLDRGLRALIQVPRCRHLLDFDVKRHWFKAQVRRLRQQASRRHGSLRLHIRRRNVFEDAYHQLRLRNADEMRGRLHITFRDEQGVDAGGLSREFFGILAKEIFNPNYALFTSTEDGSTFQPNPNSSINPDHLSYFRFVGRIVGKAVSDGYLLDAHFTRSLYKHMLGIKPTHHDMEAIDPDYYKNLKTILEYDLGDLGLDLTFSIEDHSFGRSRLIDLIPNGRNEPVTEANKAKYVSLVCQHRMTTAISSQIKAYLDGFYELVSKELIAAFTPRELELLISGLPDIDVHNLKIHTDYVGWKASDQQIQWFWNVLFSLSRNQKAAFLQFVTGSSKVPLAGFGELPGMRGVQKFSIHKTGGSAGALMSAHTCFNSLDLPPYENEEELKEKLLYAITEGAGTFMMA